MGRLKREILVFCVLVAAVEASLVAFVHVGYALASESFPRVIWDWLVVVLCCAVFALAVPAIAYLRYR